MKTHFLSSVLEKTVTPRPRLAISIGCLSMILVATSAQAGVVLSESFTGPVGSTPPNWTTTDNWKIRQYGAATVAVGEDATAGSGRKLSRNFSTALAKTWTADFDYDWRWGGNSSSEYGAYSISIDMDLLNASNNGYRVRVHQGNSNAVGNTDKVCEIFEITGGGATLLAQGAGYNEPGWNTRSLSGPDLKSIRFSWEKASGRLQVFRNTGTGLEVVASASDTSTQSFSKIVFTANGFTSSERPNLDNIEVTEPTERIWGVNGHPYLQDYEHLGQSFQIAKVAELGCTFYRVDAGTPSQRERLAQLRPIAAAQGITLLPTLTREFINKADTDQQLYEENFAKARAFTSTTDYPYVELDNEVEVFWDWDPDTEGKQKLIKDTDGSQTSHYYNDPPNLPDFPGRQAARMKIALRGLLDGAKDGRPGVKRLLAASGGWYHYGLTDILTAGDLNAPGPKWNDRPAEFEILNWHWYSGMGSPSRVIERLSTYGKPIWITEFNRTAGSDGGKETDQALKVETLATEFASFPNVEGIFAYELFDEPRGRATNSAEAHYGLCETAYSTAAGHTFVKNKEAFYAYQRVIGKQGTLPSSGDIIVDDAFLNATPKLIADPTFSNAFTSNWVTDSATTQHFNSYKHDDGTNKGTQKARFRPSIPTTGSYAVSMWFPSSTFHSSSVPVTIKHAGGLTAPILINQQNGGKWVALGTFTFNASRPNDDAYVEISNAGTTGLVVADAVKFHKQ